MLFGLVCCNNLDGFLREPWGGMECDGYFVATGREGDLLVTCALS